MLFLDELPEFSRHVLEVLREPLESGRIIISRAARQCEFPARFQLVAAMNPCPCGYAGDPEGRCRCTPDQVQRYRARISGPLLDRIDISVEVPRVPLTELGAARGGRDEDSRTVRRRVEAARERQLARASRVNAELEPAALQQACGLSAAERTRLEAMLEKLRISARAYHRVLRVARTIADLDGSERVSRVHLAEALQLRRLDRPLAG